MSLVNIKSSYKIICLISVFLFSSTACFAGKESASKIFEAKEDPAEVTVTKVAHLDLLYRIDADINYVAVSVGIVDDKVDTIDSKLDMLGCAATVLSPGLNTIDTSGTYRLPGNVTAYIVVDADDVTIDLCGATIEHTTQSVITVNTGHKNIEITNGKIKGVSGLTNNGIDVQQGCELITVNDIKVYSCNNGIYFEGASDAEVEGAKVKNCEFKSCNKGVYAQYLTKGVFEDCEAFNCVEAGFEQQSSEYNVFKNCKALHTSNDAADEAAVGF